MKHLNSKNNEKKNSMIYGPTITACTPNHLIPIELGKEKKKNFIFIILYVIKRKILSSTRMDNTVGSRPFIQEQGEVDGNPSIMRDLSGRWEEP
jgi:hypothetical protein